MVKINGQEIADIEGMLLADWLTGAGYQTKYLAVECNGQIVPKAAYVSKVLADGDVLEVVSFVGGG